MKKILLLALCAMSLMAWECKVKGKESVAIATGGKSIDMYCRHVSILVAVQYSDDMRTKLGFGYSQAADSTQIEIGKILMDQSEQCFTTCSASLASLKK